MSFVKAVDGRKRIVRVPEHFIGHPVLGKGLRLAPSEQQSKLERDRQGPTEDWSIADLRSYAGERGYDLGGARSKADVLAAITAASEAAPTTSGETSSPAETPATGEGE